MYLGIDFGNGKIKLCALFLSPRRVVWKSYPLDRNQGYLKAVAQALEAFWASLGHDARAVVSAMVSTSQSFSYPNFQAAHQEALAIFKQYLPQASFVSMDGNVYSLREAQAFSGRDCARFAGTKSLGTAYLASKIHQNALSLDTGTTSTDIVPILDGVVDPASRQDPAGFHFKRFSARLTWVGLTATPLDYLCRELDINGQCLALIPRIGFTEAVASLLELVPPELAKVHAYGGVFPTRERAFFQLAQAFGGDRLLMPETLLLECAEALHQCMIRRVAEAIRKVLAEVGPLENAVVSGLGREAIAYPALLQAGFRPENIKDLACELSQDHLASASSAYGMALLAAEHHLGKPLPLLP